MVSGSRFQVPGSRFQVPGSRFRFQAIGHYHWLSAIVQVHAVSVILSGVYEVEGSSRRNILIIVLWIDPSTTLRMTETA